MGCNMSKEGWIYCGTNKNPDLEGYIKIGKSGNTASSRETNTNGAGYNIFFAVKVDDCVFYEKLIHKIFEDFNYQNLSNPKKKKDSWTEWFEIKFENLLPFLMEIATDFEIRDEEVVRQIYKCVLTDVDNVNAHQNYSAALLHYRKFLSLKAFKDIIIL